MPQIDISTIRGDEIVEMLKRFIGTKSSSWAHEKEVRLIFENTGLFEIDFKAVTAIYFGCRMPDGDINYIMEKLKGRGLKYFKMVNVNNSYRFEAKEIEDKYGLKRVSCHGLRHTYCSFLLSQNVPLQTVSRYMGHSDSAVTLKVYSHFMPETQNQALDALNCIFG